MNNAHSTLPVHYSSELLLQEQPKAIAKALPSSPIAANVVMPSQLGSKTVKPEVPPAKIPLRTASKLALQDLRDLCEGKILALYIPGFYSAETAQQLSQQLIHHAQFERYFRAPDIGVQRTGMTFFETNGSNEMLLRYYDEALPGTQALRAACAPLLSPIDRLRLELGDIWLDGVSIENAHGRPMLAGIGRVFENGFELPPHQDILARDLRDATLAPLDNHQPLKRQLSTNVYLQPADEGGELEVWDLSPSFQEQQAIRDEEFAYEGIVDRATLPEPAFVLSPQPGDLILFDSGCIHAVRASQGRARVSMSLFLGYRGANRPLTYWN